MSTNDGNHRSADANLWFTINLRSLIYGLSDNNLVHKSRIFSAYSDHFRMQLRILLARVKKTGTNKAIHCYV